jgi:hypothetical protein
MCVCDVVQVSEWQSRLGAAFCTLLGAAAEAAAPIATLFLPRAVLTVAHNFAFPPDVSKKMWGTRERRAICPSCDKML